MEIKIGPYTLSRRTRYSKFQVLDNDGKNITDTTTGQRIISDYNKQIEHPECYFSIDGTILKHFESQFDIKCVFVPEGIESISSSAFVFADVSYIHLPDSITEMGFGVFSDANALKEITISENCHMNRGTFAGCKRLEKVILSNGIVSIPNDTFFDCFKLRDIVLPDTITHIGDFAFQKCASLYKINIPRDFKTFGKFPFERSGIEVLKFNYNLEDSKNPNDTYGDFLSNSRIYRLEIGRDVSYIDPYLFASTDAKKITEINYLGSEKEYLKFKKENKKLFKSLNSIRVCTVKDNIDLNDLENKENILDFGEGVIER